MGTSIKADLLQCVNLFLLKWNLPLHEVMLFLASGNSYCLRMAKPHGKCAMLIKVYPYIKFNVFSINGAFVNDRHDEYRLLSRLKIFNSNFRNAERGAIAMPMT